MPENKFDLNKALNAAKLYTKIDYGDIHTPNISDVQQTGKNFEDWRKSQGYKTVQEKMEEVMARMPEDINSEDVYDWYNAYQSDPKKQAEFRQQGAKAAGALMTIPMTVLSAGTMGWVPALTTTATGMAGGYGGYKAGEYLDGKLDTKWIAPTLGFVGGMAGGSAGYKGLVNLGSRGWLPKGDKFIYGSQFVGDVAADGINRGIRTTRLSQSLLEPAMRFKVGDIEINDPNLYYRQGTKEMGDDFLKSGIVREGTANHIKPKFAGTIQLTKKIPFKNPMFSQGKLWYGMDSEMTDLLVANPSAKMQMANQHASPTTIASRAGVRRIPIRQLTSDETVLYRLEPGYGFRKQGDLSNTSYKFFERPSKLTLAERMGIPKGDRGNLTQDQLDALDDLMHYNTSGKYRWRLTYNDETGFTRTTASNTPKGSIPGVKALLDHGATVRGYENSPVDLRTKTGSWTIWPGRKNAPAKFSGGDFPIPEGMEWAPGNLSVMLDGNTGKALKVVMTSPRVDLANSLEDASQSLIESLPNTIDKNIMRRFWQNNDQVVLPGSYLSGDNGTLPLGLNGISAIDQGKGMSGAISEILHPARFRPHGSGLSPDSMLSILKQGQRPGHAVRYGPGFTQLNDSAVYNKHIYDAWTKYKSGTMSADEFKKVFDDWFVSQGGRPLEIKTTPKFRRARDNNGNWLLVQQEQKPYIVFPHPYVHYKEEGGKINPQQ